MPHYESRRPPRVASSRDAGKLFSTPNRRGFESAPLEGEPTFFTVAQLAIRWGISERQVRRYIASEELRATWFGRAVRVHAAMVAEFESTRRSVK